jgi:hypothetical protein
VDFHSFSKSTMFYFSKIKRGFLPLFNGHMSKEKHYEFADQKKYDLRAAGFIHLL